MGKKPLRDLIVLLVVPVLSSFPFSCLTIDDAVVVVVVEVEDDDDVVDVPFFAAILSA